jgi:hypothetical protein
MGRKTDQLSSVVGYAAGQQNSGNTCYYYNAPDSLYEKQGHAEVTQVGIDSASADKDYGMFAETYFAQFKKTPFGMIRQVWISHCAGATWLVLVMCSILVSSCSPHARQPSACGRPR